MKTLFKSSAALALLGAAGLAHAAHPDATYKAELTAMNSSGATAEVTVAIRGDTLTVVLQASGIAPSESHAQHIHGLSDASQNATCPDIRNDTDNDNLVSVPEGAGSYGGVLLALNDDDGNPPMADANGNLAYSQTFTLGANGNIATPDLLPLENRAIVLHGVSVMGSYDASLPAACGQLVEQ